MDLRPSIIGGRNAGTRNQLEPRSAAPTIATGPLVSVVVPAFNHARYVVDCLESVLASTYPTKELIVLDDGSTDETLAQTTAWMARNQDQMPMSVVSRPNRGLARTLNELLLMARGEFVMPIASDDAILPDALATLVDASQRLGVNAVFGDALVVDENGLPISPSVLFDLNLMSRRRLSEDVTRELILTWGVAGPVILYRRLPVIQMGGYDERLRVEDWDFYLRLARRGWLKYVDATVGVYRRHTSNASLDLATLRSRYDEERRVTLRAARTFHGRYRALLIAKYIYRSPLLSGYPDEPASRARRALRRLLRRGASGVRGG